MNEECIDPNKPTVDNESLQCEELFSTDCIVTEDADTYLRYGKGATLTTVLGIISRAIRKLSTTVYVPKHKSYIVALEQSNTNNPTEALVIDNSKGITPVYTRTGVGQFTLTATGLFVLGKFFVSPPNNQSIFTGVSETFLYKYYVEWVDVNTINIKTSKKTTTGTTVLEDGLLDGVNTVIEIRFYD